MQRSALACHRARQSWLSGNRRRHAVMQPCRPPGKVLTTPEKNSVRASSSSSSSDSNSSMCSTSIPFHNRRHELECLHTHCSKPPKAITVIVGPRSTGKTAVLKEYMASRGLMGSQCFVDARRTPMPNPSALASELLRTGLPKVLQPLFPAARGIAQLLAALKGAVDAAQDKLKLGDTELTISGKAVSALLETFAQDMSNRGETPPLAVVTEAYISLLDAWDQARTAGMLQDSSPPVLVLDEANILMAWCGQDQAERQELLQFFIAISKVDSRSHVCWSHLIIPFKPG